MRTNLSLSILTLLCISINIQAQNPTALQYGNQLTKDDLSEYLSILASDAMEGRKTGERGQKMAAVFIRATFEELGLKPPPSGNYFQSFELYSRQINDQSYIKIGSQQFTGLNTIAYYGSTNTAGEVSVPVLFVGQGRDEDYEGLNVEGKGVLILIEGTGGLGSRIDKAIEKKAKIVFVLNSTSQQQYDAFLIGLKNYANGKMSYEKPEPSVTEGTFFISQQVAEKLFATSYARLLATATKDPIKTLRKMKPSQIRYKSSFTLTNAVKTENVIGYIEGKSKKNEFLVISAHYDHLGKSSSTDEDVIYNGADDDGSGTSAILEIAKLFAKAKAEGNGPERSIVFIAFTGEEVGLFGSQYYTENPLFPLASTVVDLNVDMIGRSDPLFKGEANYVHLIGSDKLSMELHQLSETVNNQYAKMTLDYTYNDAKHPDRYYYRSDHWNFAKNNVPIIFYMDGTHPDYHKTSDEVDKIDFDLLTNRAKLIFYTAWEIANREKRISVDTK